MKALLPLLLLAACGGRNEVHADCLTFHLDGTVDEVSLTKNVVLARALMNPLVPVEEFCPSFSGINFEIRSDISWPCSSGVGGLCTGQTFDWGVSLNRHVTALVQELFLVWDESHGGVLLRDPYAGWGVNGRNDTISWYQHSVTDISYKP